VASISQSSLTFVTEAKIHLSEGRYGVKGRLPSLAENPRIVWTVLRRRETPYLISSVDEKLISLTSGSCYLTQLKKIPNMFLKHQ
jgi:hypothetical protein